MEVGLGPCHIVLYGDPAALPKKGAEPQFSAHFTVAKRLDASRIDATWYGGTEVGLSPGDFVFDGDPATPRKKGIPTSTQFLAHVYCGQTAGYMKTPLGTELNLGPARPHCIRQGPSYPRNWGHSSPPLFGACLLWPRSPISATADELLFKKSTASLHRHRQHLMLWELAN